jgi:hypothetical protein
LEVKLVQFFTRVVPARLSLYGSACSFPRTVSVINMLPQARLVALLFGGMVFGALCATPSHAVAAQVAADEVATEAACPSSEHLALMVA